MIPDELSRALINLQLLIKLYEEQDSKLTELFTINEELMNKYITFENRLSALLEIGVITDISDDPEESEQYLKDAGLKRTGKIYRFAFKPEHGSGILTQQLPLGEFVKEIYSFIQKKLI